MKDKSSQKSSLRSEELMLACVRRRATIFLGVGVSIREMRVGVRLSVTFDN